MSPSPLDDEIHPFQLSIPESDLRDLRARLRATRFSPHPPGNSWGSGVPADVLQQLVPRWELHDWRASEARLNKHTHIHTRISGQNFHSLHVTSSRANATPLLLLHGWPGSFLEFELMIGPLTDPVSAGGTADDAYDLVIPSHPGFGFSTPLSKNSWTPRDVGVAYLKLMDRLGYESFAVHGGDYGALVAAEIARTAPERLLGVHVNGTLMFPEEIDDDIRASLTPLELDRLRRINEFAANESGYIAIQSTRPGLIGAMTGDSPVALLAWMYDKQQAWTHPPEVGGIDVLGERFVFDNACLYWFTNCSGSAAEVVYAETSRASPTRPDRATPVGAIMFAHDVGIRAFHERDFNVTRWTDIPGSGGHFAALEEPELLVADIRAFLSDCRNSGST